MAGRKDWMRNVLFTESDTSNGRSSLAHESRKMYNPLVGFGMKFWNETTYAAYVA